MESENTKQKAEISKERASRKRQRDEAEQQYAKRRRVQVAKDGVQVGDVFKGENKVTVWEKDSYHEWKTTSEKAAVRITRKFKDSDKILTDCVVLTDRCLPSRPVTFQFSPNENLWIGQRLAIPDVRYTITIPSDVWQRPHQSFHTFVSGLFSATSSINAKFKQLPNYDRQVLRIIAQFVGAWKPQLVIKCPTTQCECLHCQKKNVE